nr:immunoglobulin heavy chain junction region [Macaca mulatta]
CTNIVVVVSATSLDSW